MADPLPLVLLHGWGVPGRVWQAVEAGLDSRRRVLVIDLPGYGHRPIVRPYRPDVLAHALALDAIGPCVVCGWSMGGMVAQAWAAQCPEQVRGLILVSSSPTFLRQADWCHGLAPEALAEFSAALTQDSRATLLRFLALQARGGEATRVVTSTLREVLSSGAEPDHEVLALGLELLRTVDLRDYAGRIACPTLVVHGAADLVCPAGAGAWLAGSIAGARLVQHAAAAHVPFLSHPAWFQEQVNAFVRDIE